MINNRKIAKTLATIFTIICITTPVFAENTTAKNTTNKNQNIEQNTVQNANTNVNISASSSGTSNKNVSTNTKENTNTSQNSSTNTNTKVNTNSSTSPSSNTNISNKTEPNTSSNVTVQNQSQTPKPVQTQTTNSNRNNTTTSKTNSSTTSTTKSSPSNANLSNLGITPHDFSGFNEDKTEYNVTVPNTIKEVEVYGTPKASGASITGTGIVKLEEGNNVAKVVVTAQDGTTKTYTINIKRLKTGEKETVNISNSEIGLDKLEITGFQLEPSFSKDIYQYKVKVEGGQNTLDITAQSNQGNVKIIGNENLVDGENVITIIVADDKETSAATYQIYANKNMIAQEEIDRQLKDEQIKKQIKFWVIVALIVMIVICIVMLFISIHKKVDNSEENNQKNKSNTQRKEDNKSGKHSKK